VKRKLIVELSDGRKRVAYLDRAIAWAAARGIAKDTLASVLLIGEFGTAEFNSVGAGSVVWNDKSPLPGERTFFGASTTVCI
jgi:hypothetical protein